MTQIYLNEDSLYLRSRLYRILWSEPLWQLITWSNTDVTIDIDWQPNPRGVVSGKLGITEDMLIEHGVFGAWQEYKRVSVAEWLPPMDTWQNNNFTITRCSFVVVASEQAHLWVTRASGEERKRSDPAGRSLVKRHQEMCASQTWACSHAIVVVTASKSMFALIENQNFAEEPGRKIYHASCKSVLFQI